MVMQRWEPLRELRQMEDTMNRLWRGFSGRTGNDTGSEGWNIAIDVIRKQDEIEVKASVPGIKPEDIDVSVEDNVLVMKAEKKDEYEGSEADYLVRERSYGSYYRALRLPETVDTNKIKCEYDNGVLSIILPKAEEKKKKQIKVNVTKAIEAGKK
jgi:HSP20 family protein